MNALKECRELVYRLRRLKDERESVYAAGTNTAPNYSGMPHDFGVGRKVEVSAGRIADLDREIARLETTLSDKKKAAGELIAACGNEVYEKVLTYYYLEGKTIRELARILNYSEPSTKRLKREAYMSIF